MTGAHVADALGVEAGLPELPARLVPVAVLVGTDELKVADGRTVADESIELAGAVPHDTATTAATRQVASIGNLARAVWGIAKE